MLLQRWLTAIVGIPILIILINWGSGVLFTIFIAIISMLTLWEYYGIVFSQNTDYQFHMISVLGMILCPILMYAAYFNLFHLMIALIVADMLICNLICLMQYQQNPSMISIAAKQLQGLVYIPLLLSHLILLRNTPEGDGIRWIFFLLLLVASGDTGAYYTGRYLGKHKLSPHVSPGKTIEGLFGGIFCTLLTGLLFAFLWLPQLNIVKCVVLIIAVSLAGPLGDLFESMLKRQGQVKDSSGLLPGHGGFLDRIDALLFAIPVIFYLKKMLI
ncbi:MAG: phosphatidate cytidylyltransferase [Desulfobacterales bacterium]|nr:phosphatidate cytidylyltransferase [Desulfobacterales bacterium]